MLENIPFKQIIDFGKPIGPQIINIAKRDENVIKILQELELDDTKPLGDVDG
ncbi:MAG: hypothetical protein F6K24_02955, partial [Okeania sp. SIO2D1]|nr:hypothetical protein [Okeania sp. SIO2D1]